MHAGLCQDAGFIVGAVVGFVGVDVGTGRQPIEQFVNRGEIMVARREQDTGHGHARCRADQMQTPTEELLLLGRAVAAVGAPPHLATAAGAHAPTDGDGQAIDHEVTDGGVGLHDTGPDGLHEQGQPRRQRVQAPVEARRREVRREIAQGVEHVQGTALVIPKGVRCHDRHGQHLRIAQGCQAMALMAQRLHRLVNDHVDRYNRGVVHGSSSGRHCPQATIVSGVAPMNGN